MTTTTEMRNAVDRFRWLDAPRFVPWCLLAAVLVRLVWAFSFAPTTESDFAWYVQHALALAHGQGYTDGGVPTAYFPPGYPGFLALLFRLFGDQQIVISLGNVALQAGILLLMWQLARKLFRSERIGRMALLLFACWPNAIAYCVLPASEHLFILLMLLGLWLIHRGEHRWGWLTLAGVILGLATFTRPQGVLIPVAYFGITLWPAVHHRKCRQWLGRIVLVMGVLFLTVLPWLARNRVVLGKAVLTDTGGLNLYIGNNTSANGTYVMTSWAQQVLAAGLSEVETDDLFRRQALAELQAAPWRPIALAPAKLYQLYAMDYDGAQWTFGHLPTRSSFQAQFLRGWMTLSEVFYLVLWALVLLAWRRIRPLPMTGIAVIVVFTLLYLALYGMPRYHLPMVPWLMMYAAASLVSVSALRRAALRRR